MSDALPDYRITLLGPLVVERAGEVLDTGSWQRTALTLLKLLATGYGLRRLRDELIEILWPEARPEAGASNLRYVVNVLRKLLGGGEPPPIAVERGWVGLNPAYGWDVDLVRFKALIADPDDGGLPEAMSLYRGEPLVEDRYEDWAAPVRERIRTLRRERSLRMADRDGESALAWLEPLLADEPLDEEVFRRVLVALDAQGRRVEALRRFQRFEDRLRRELDVPPSAETLAVVAAMRADVREPPESTVSDEGGGAAAGAGPNSITWPALGRGGYLGSLATDGLIGRHAELAAIEGQLAAVLAGEGRFIALAGEPGVGKTRLAQEATQLAVKQGFIVATGRCYELEENTPYYPFLDALTAAYCAAPASLRGEVPARWPYLARLLPEHVPQTVIPDNTRDDQQFLLRAVTGFLSALAAQAPIALMLDDLHWSDAASLRLLLHLCRHTRSRRIFLLGTYRDVEIGRHHSLGRALHDLTREGLLDRIAVRRLDPAQTAALVAAELGERAVSGELAQLIHAPTDGNPFFVRQVVRSLVERGDVYREGDGWCYRDYTTIDVPESVRDAIGQRLSRLSEETQEILRAASILGQTFCFADLEGTGGRGEERTEAALQEAADHGIIQEIGAEEYGFDHALTRQAIGAEIAAWRRRRLHRAAAETIAGRRRAEAERRAAEVAWHYLEGGDDTRALPWAFLAGDRAKAALAHDEAERHYRMALEIAAELGDHAREAEAREKLGEVLIVVSRHDEGLKLEEQALALYRTLDDLAGEGRAMTRIAWAHAGRGEYGEPLARLRETAGRLTALGPSAVLVDLRVAIYAHLANANRIAEALREVDAFEAMARLVGYERYVAGSGYLRGALLVVQGRYEEGVASIERALPLIEAANDLTALGWAIDFLAALAGRAGDLERAEGLFERGLAIQQRRGDPTALSLSMVNLAFIAWLRGEWGQAMAHHRRAATYAEERPDVPLGAVRLGHLALFLVARGEWEEAMRQAEAANAAAGARRTYAGLAQLALAELELLTDRPDAARLRLERVLGDEQTAGWYRTFGLPLLVRAYLDTESFERAAAELGEARSRAESERNRLALLQLLSAEAALLARRGDVQAAEGALAGGLADARRIGVPYLEAQLLFAQGMVRQRYGESEQARGPLEAARVIFHRLGARPYADRVERALAALGGRR